MRIEIPLELHQLWPIKVNEFVCYHYSHIITNFQPDPPLHWSFIHHIPIKPHVCLMATSCSMPATTLSSYLHLYWLFLFICHWNPLGTVQ